jgi:hypothetical protein
MGGRYAFPDAGYAYVFVCTIKSRSLPRNWRAISIFLAQEPIFSAQRYPEILALLERMGDEYRPFAKSPGSNSRIYFKRISQRISSGSAIDDQPNLIWLKRPGASRGAGVRGTHPARLVLVRRVERGF